MSTTKQLIQEYVVKSGGTSDEAGLDLSIKYDLASAIATQFVLDPVAAAKLWQAIPNIINSDHDDVIDSVADILWVNYRITINELDELYEDTTGKGE